MKKTGYICSAETMIGAIREIGIVPFFRSPVPGWSIEDLTHPDAWFYSSDILGPWDWKIDAIHDGIVDGPSGNPFWAKFLEEAPESSGNPVSTGCSPEESRQVIIGHLAGLYPGQRRVFERII